MTNDFDSGTSEVGLKSLNETIDKVVSLLYKKPEISKEASDFLASNQCSSDLKAYIAGEEKSDAKNRKNIAIGIVIGAMIIGGIYLLKNNGNKQSEGEN